MSLEKYRRDTLMEEEGMMEEGTPRDIILEELKRKLKNSFSYESGRILRSMCTRPHPLAKQIFTRFLDVNAGDPELFPYTSELEQEIVQMLGSLLSNPKASGHIVTGGTESNLLALWVARKLAGKGRREIIVPTSAHYSFDRAADMLGMKLIKVGLNEKFEVDVDAVRRRINSKTAAIVGVAGSTDLGVVDPIRELSEIALENNIYLHVDAAFGGFILPFLKDLGYNVPDFDFKLEGVCSISIDPHKMGLAPIPAGCILFRNRAMEEVIGMEVPYFSGGVKQYSLVGTRSGASIIAVWVLLRYLGRQGYRRIVGRCMRLTHKLANGIERIKGLDIIIKPVMNIVCFKSEVYEIAHIAKRLKLKGWAISFKPDYIRVVIMPHVKERHIMLFLKDLKQIMKN